MTQETSADDAGSDAAQTGHDPRRDRIAARTERERQGTGRPAPGAVSDDGELLDEEIERIVATVDEAGQTLPADELARRASADTWEDGRFRRAVRVAAGEGRVRRSRGGAVSPAGGTNGDVEVEEPRGGG